MIEEKTSQSELNFAFDGLVNAREDIFAPAPLTGQNSYYRSSLIHNHYFLNPLAAAAAPLLILHHQIVTHKIIDYQNLFQTLIHETMAFETAARQAHYSSDIIYLARFFLLSLLDESLFAHVDVQHQNENFKSILHYFNYQEAPQEHFFAVLDKLSKDPWLYPDVLELAYLILCLGFKGKYQEHAGENHALALAQLRHELYQLIKQQRRNLNPMIVASIAEKPQMKLLKMSLKKYRGPKTMFLTAFSLMALSFFVFMGIAHHALAHFSKSLVSVQTLFHSSGSG